MNASSSPGASRPPARPHHTRAGGHEDTSEYLALGEANMILAIALLVLACFNVAPAAAPAPERAVVLEPQSTASESNADPAGQGMPAQPSHRLLGRVEQVGAPGGEGVVVAVPPDVFELLRHAPAAKFVTEKGSR